MSRTEFYEMRLGEYWEALKFYREERQADMQHIGELVRGATIRLWNLQANKKSQFKDVRKFWKMPWDVVLDEEADEVRRLNSLSTEERENAVEAFFNNIVGGRNGR